jgi:hypothetical protein
VRQDLANRQAGWWPGHVRETSNEKQPMLLGLMPKAHGISGSCRRRRIFIEEKARLPASNVDWSNQYQGAISRGISH